MKWASRTGALVLATTLVAGGGAWAQDCGSLESHYGPFDFRVNRDKLPIVENFHFNARVEALVSGQSARTPGPDLEYVLKTFPNHPRALAAVSRWAKVNRTAQPSDMKISVDCHFERALRFRNDDAVVRMLFAQWLNQTQRKPQALQQLAQVDPKGNPQTTANLGLLYVELGEFELALARAHEVQAAGYPIPLLKAALVKAGRWQEPAAAAAASAPEAAASPAAR